MANTTLSPFDNLRALLRTKEGENNDLEIALRSEPEDRVREVAYNKAVEYSQQGLINPLTLDNIRNAVLPINPDPFEQNPQQKTPPPQPGFSFNLGGSNGHSSGSGGANIVYGEIGQHIRGIQEEKLKQEFETLLSNTDPDKLMDEVGQFFDKNFDAQKLLSEQYQTLRESIDALAFSGEGDKKQTIKDLLNQQEKDHLQQLNDPYRGITNQNAKQKIDERRKKEAAQEEEIKRRIQAAQSKKDKERALRELLRHRLEVTQREVGIISPPVIPEKIRKEKGYKFTYTTEQLYDMSDVLSRIFSTLGKRSYTDEEETTVITPYTTTTTAPQQEITPVPNTPTFGNPENAQGNEMNPRMRNPLNRLLQRRKGKNLAKKLGNEVEKEVKKVGRSLAKKVALWALGALVELLADILPYLLIALAIVAMVIVIVMWISGQGGTTNLSPTPTPGPTLSPCTTSTDCLSKLQVLGINLSGDLSDNGDPNGKAKYVYAIMTQLTKSPSQFAKLLNLPSRKINVVIPGYGCYGHADGVANILNLYWCGDNYITTFMLTHELGHFIQFRNDNLEQKFLNGYFKAGVYLNTYNCLHDYDPQGFRGPYAAECFSDMVGEYVVYKQWRDAVRQDRELYPPGLSNYPDFPNVAGGFYYNFAKQNIFGGVEY